MVNSSIRPGLLGFAAMHVHEGLARWLWPYQTLLLMARSESRWNMIMQSGFGFGGTICVFFMPMLVTLAGLEGLGLKKWSRWYDATGLSRPLTTNEAVDLEALRCLMILVAMLVCSHLIKVFSATFRNRNTYQEVMTVVVYAFAPICLMRSLLAFYPFNEWLLWAFGIVLGLKVLYHGLPRILQPDSVQALGLFFSSALALCLITLLERFLTLFYLCKFCRPPALI